MNISFFGHSSYSYCEEDEIRLLELIETVSKGSQIDFYLGGYGNFDSFAKRCAKRYQQKHTNAKVIFVTPYLSKWLDDRKDYIEKEYDEILYPELEHTPPKYAISKRNEWIELLILWENFQKFSTLYFASKVVCFCGIKKKD